MTMIIDLFEVLRHVHVLSWCDEAEKAHRGDGEVNSIVEMLKE